MNILSAFGNNVKLKFCLHVVIKKSIEVVGKYSAITPLSWTGATQVYSLTWQLMFPLWPPVSVVISLSEQGW